MNVEEECEHDDDIYGHSYDDHDYCTSPGTAALYLYDRNKAQAAFAFGSPGVGVNQRIEEEEEDIEDDASSQSDMNQSSSQSSLIRQNLSALDNAKLNSCLEMMRSVLGENFAEATMMNAIVESNFDGERAIDRLLNQCGSAEQPKPQRLHRGRKCRAATADQSTINGKMPPAGNVPDLSGGMTKLNFTSGPADDEEENKASVTVVATTTTSKRPVTGSSDALLPSSANRLSTPAVAGTTTGDKSVVAAATKSTTAKSERSNEAWNEFGDISATFGGSATAVAPTTTPRREPTGEPTAVTPSTIHRSASKAKIDKLDVQKEYDNRKAAGKDYINMVVIGHVDAGKSTLMGHVLYQLGFVSKKAMHKFEQESRKAGKGSFAYAWVLDETEEERCRGVTMDIAQTRFETPSKVVTLLDAPGHKDFIPNMITGAAQADVAVLVINATKGEFETGFEAGGQTREHTMLVRSLGVSQLLVAVNKMDTVNWSKDRYDEIVRKLGAFLRQAGFKDADISFVPCSGLVGDNLTQLLPDSHELRKWYSGPTLAQQIDLFRPPLRPVLDKPLRMCLTDVFKPMGAGVAVAGTIQAGSVQAGDRVLVIPAGEVATVKGVTIDDAVVGIGFAGDNAVVTLTGVDTTNLSIGSILCDPSSPVETTTRFRARIVVFNISFPITKGFPVVLHYQSLTEQAHIRHLVCQLHRNTGEIVRKRPRCLVKNTSAVIELEVDRPICLELYSNFKELGRFMLRSGGTTIAAGLVTEILSSKSQPSDTTQ
jgi:elongation factor 1 alpha-like protein